MNIYDAMNYINSFSKLGKPVTDLNRFTRIMNALGNPQDRLKFVHVAGTNGKGSTVRMLAGTLTLAGYKTGEFTSPFIRVYNDRISIDGKNITDEELCEVICAIKPIMDGLCEECSQFEISTAIAFTYYAAKKCDIVVLETGLGGLLDCTNIIKTTVTSVITHIALDHTKILGDTVEAIARQKAGIIKRGSPVVLACSQQREAEIVISGTAAAKGCELITPDLSKLKIISSDYTGNRFKYKGSLFETKMIGRHQIDNALTVVETVEALRNKGFEITYENAYSGIANAQVPSRCQLLRQDKPLIIIDGAHNPDGMKALADFVRTVPKAPKIMICGMMEDKDWETALGFITRYIDVGLCVDGFAPKTVFAPKLAEMFSESKTVSLSDALSKAETLAGDNGMVLIAGSLYLAAALQRMSGDKLD